MKKIISILFVSCIALVSAASSRADTTQQTPITEQTYSDFQTACFDSCFNGARTKVPAVKAQTYCMCACAQASMNCRETVQKFNLKYEQELPAHQADMSLNVDQLNTCKTKAVL